MSRLVCPMCSEGLQEEGDHFYKHFKYKKFPCGETGCTREFYSGAERNIHCTEMKHKRSFQNKVYPYMDKLISIVVADARALATNGNDIDSVIKNRWGTTDGDETTTSSESSTKDADPGNKKRNSVASLSTTPAAKKSKSAVGNSSSTGAKATFATSSADSSTRSTDDGAAQAISSTSSIHLPNPVADSTTNDNPHFETPTVPPAKKQRKKRDSATSSNTAKTPEAAAAAETEEEEVPDDFKIECKLCAALVPYDLKCRNEHAKKHIKDLDEKSEDYEEVLKGAADAAFPGLPNGALNCQLCMEPEQNVITSRQREHIETRHKNELPDLKCPKCDKPFVRQCHLSKHMKHKYQLEISRYQDKTFQGDRIRRLSVVKALQKKYFPMCPEKKPRAAKKTKQPTTPALPEAPPPSYALGPLSSALESDIRVREMAKTRRAPRYTEDSSSDENEDEEEEEDDSSSNTIPDEVDYSADIVFVEQRFISEVTQKLLSRAATPLVSIKKEVVDQAEEEMKVEEPSTKPAEQFRPPTPVFARFDPTAPPPGYLSYTPLHSHPGAELLQIPLPPPTFPRKMSPASTTSAPATTRDRDRDRNSRERTQSPPSRRHPRSSSRPPYDNNRQSSSSHYDDRHRRGGGSSRSYGGSGGGSFPSRQQHHDQNRGGARRDGGAQSENEGRDRSRNGGYRSTNTSYSRPPSANSAYPPYHRGRNQRY